MSYVGRFAPSPTGPLHVGSLTTALASFLDAKRHGGKWLLRIEDIDPPREHPGAADSILRTLDAVGLHWDALFYQSQSRERYEQGLEVLVDGGRAYRCSCSRSRLRQSGRKGPLGYRYPGTCRDRAVSAETPAAVRVRVEPGVVAHVDRLQGTQRCDLAALSGDYVVWRRDRLPAYHLAAVLDDAAQGITDVVRGIDLLPATSVHLHLQSLLGLDPLRYAHVPVIVNARGQKLSKQTGALAVDPESPELARTLLGYLGIELPGELTGAPYAELWRWAATQWPLEASSGITKIIQR